MSRILRAGPALWCERPVATAGLLVDADDHFRAFYRAARGARRPRLLAGWQFDSDVELWRGDAAGTGHRLGIYYTVPEPPEGEPARATYIHSKIMVIDNRFLTVGSANLTNRSVGLDTELNASFEAERSDEPLGASIASALGRHRPGPLALRPRRRRRRRRATLALRYRHR